MARFNFPQLCRSKIPQAGELVISQRRDRGAPVLGGRPRRRGRQCRDWCVDEGLGANMLRHEIGMSAQAEA